MSLFAELQKKPVFELERKFIDFVERELHFAAQFATMYFDSDYTANPSTTALWEELEKVQSIIKSEIHTSLGELSKEHKYLYLLVIKDWLDELNRNKRRKLEEVWQYNLHSDSKPVQEEFSRNMGIIKEAFSGDLFKVYEAHIDSLIEYRSLLVEKYESGVLTANSPKEVAEIIIKHKPQFSLSKELMLPTISGKENTTVLDRYQTALLFDLLREKGAIIDLNPKSLANVLSRLTPHSEHNLRTKALAYIKEIKNDHPDFRDKTHQESNHNLLSVKNVLLEIIEELDALEKANADRK